jgi:hypothetical protein
VTLRLVEDAVTAGARREQACATLGLSARTMECWRAGDVEDGRHGPSSPPANKLSEAERAEVLSLVTSPGRGRRAIGIGSRRSFCIRQARRQ